MRKIVEEADLFALGGTLYGLIEILWRGYTHWSMVALGGGLFLALGKMNRALPKRTPLLLRGVLGGGVITAAEFAAGCVLNIKCKLAVWDYSSMPGQLLGQVCLPYSLAWAGLSVLACGVHEEIDHRAWQETAA